MYRERKHVDKVYDIKYIYVVDERTPEPPLWSGGRTPLVL